MRHKKEILKEIGQLENELAEINKLDRKNLEARKQELLKSLDIPKYAKIYKESQQYKKVKVHCPEYGGTFEVEIYADCPYENHIFYSLYDYKPDKTLPIGLQEILHIDLFEYQCDDDNRIWAVLEKNTIYCQLQDDLQVLEDFLENTEEFDQDELMDLIEGYKESPKKVTRKKATKKRAGY